MFKKPLNGIKTSAPLRSSDRRKLKQRVITAFGISPEDGELLVPEGIQSVKFSTYLEEPGIAYLAPDGNPLWFTLGKGSDDLIPTVYTLWKQRDLLPAISTPRSVIPILVGGADLMIPGVVYHAPSLSQNQLVSVVQYNKDQEAPLLLPPLAVGRMALSSDQLDRGQQDKGKAVLMLHTWKDHLWELGLKGDVPEPVPIHSEKTEQVTTDGQETQQDNEPKSLDQQESSTNEALKDLTIQDSDVKNGQAPCTGPSYTPQEISILLHASLLQAITSPIPSTVFPISATAFYTNYILPSRPAFPNSVVPHSGPSPPEASPCPSASEITIKASSNKSLTAFLKTEEKAGLLTLKAPQKHAQQGDLLITSVNANHEFLAGHISHVTIRDVETKAAQKAARQEKERQDQAGGGEVRVTELWKPHQSTVVLFETMGANPAHIYSFGEIKSLVNSYIISNSLANPQAQENIILDGALLQCVFPKVNTKSKGKDKEAGKAPTGSMKREDLVGAIVKNMQSWYEVSDHKGTVRKKGELKPIQIVMKARHNRRVATIISGFEPFLVIDAEDMAEELRKVCAGATSVSPIPGKSGLEVLVQGKQSAAVVEYLTTRGIPKKWIEIHGTSGKK